TDALVRSVVASGFSFPFVALLFSAFLTAFYMFRVVFLAFWGTSGIGHRSSGVGPAQGPAHAAHQRDGHAHDPSHLHDARFLMTGPLWVLALLALTIGIYFTVSEPW